jgi:3-oxosteroid 1-dehydrogenase
MAEPLVVVGAGMGGLAAAITAARGGRAVTVVEKADRLGGALAYSGGQVWVGANHVQEREGMDDDVTRVMTYVRAIAESDPELLDDEVAETWVRVAPEAARMFEDAGVIRWEIIPDYPDYYFPEAPGSAPRGRYLTGAPFDAARLGSWQDRLLPGPHFPSGVTYGEMFAWGGQSSKTVWDWDLLARRRDEGVMTFGHGIAAAFVVGAVAAGVDLRTDHEVVELLTDDAGVHGVRCRTPDGTVDLRGTVVLASGSYDWDEDAVARFSGLPWDETGSVAPGSVAGDGLRLATDVGAALRVLPPRLAPHLPGYRLAAPQWPGDTGYRHCMEHCLPHTFVVNRAGERFCDDSFHRALIGNAVGADGQPTGNVPMFMIWDEDHHAKYGLGKVMPGDDYPEGLVVSAPTLRELGERLGIDGEALEATAARFNDHALRGEDPDFGRGTNLSVQKFRGDANHAPNPNLGPVARPPFHGLHLRLLGTGISASGLDTDAFARVRDSAGRPIPGLYATGACAAPSATGSGYNSGYSLSRAMTFGYVAARHAARGSAAG